MNRRDVLCASFGLLFTACAEEAPMHAFLSEDYMGGCAFESDGYPRVLAVGGTIDLHASEGAEVCRGRDLVDVLDVTAEPAGIVEVTRGTSMASELLVRGIAAGETRLHVTTENGRDVDLVIRTNVPTSGTIDVGASLDGTRPLWLVGIGDDVDASFNSGSETLAGTGLAQWTTSPEAEIQVIDGATERARIVPRHVGELVIAASPTLSAAVDVSANPPPGAQLVMSRGGDALQPTSLPLIGLRRFAIYVPAQRSSTGIGAFSTLIGVGTVSSDGRRFVNGGDRIAELRSVSGDGAISASSDGGSIHIVASRAGNATFSVFTSFGAAAELAVTSF